MVRYNVSYINNDGYRVLFGPNQGRHFSGTRAEKEAWLVALMQNTGEDILEHLCGKNSRGTFRVDPFECYENGDAKGIYVEETDGSKRIVRLKITVEYEDLAGNKFDFVPVDWKDGPGVDISFNMNQHRPIKRGGPDGCDMQATGEDQVSITAQRVGPPYTPGKAKEPQ